MFTNLFFLQNLINLTPHKYKNTTKNLFQIPPIKLEIAPNNLTILSNKLLHMGHRVQSKNTYLPT
jgi:hypothetical protein